MTSTRPQYETERDLQAEAMIAAAIAERTGRKPVKLKRYYPCDWMLVHPEPSGTHVLLEAKARAKKYGRYMLSLHKAAMMMLYARVGGLYPMLAVRWEDTGEIGTVVLREDILDPGVGGRTDRDDPQDIEPVVYIDAKYFSIIK